ncbi:GGDEF domain-containing protein [Maridesulfovibrio hydrothermalis]|uniref:diguanylate cyclase n=1 Tax=Maridesulfovibrio hydrothermalis AM13 = DSM 14728 TaxID=1121451 RepID=L0RF99_9BACT|nr:GGDEF domain-containing protein [Maridesulfovibrio hydrothermalis]CCO25448.1 Diguanylate cyclase [Maridesulfovibrio hydrothermalis AM13 = DSM 14728]
MGKLNWLGEFEDPKVEKAFQCEKWPSVRGRLLFLYFITIASYIGGAYSDFFDLGAGDGFKMLFSARTTVCMFGFFAFLLLLANRLKHNTQYVLMFLSMFLFILVESLELWVKFSVVGSLSVPATVFMVLAYYILLPPRVVYSLFAGLCGSSLYLFTLATLVPVTTGTFANSALYFFFANAFGIFFLATFGVSLRREYAARSDLEKLIKYDELTGAYSRRRVLEAGNNIFKSSRRFNNSLTVLMMDIDNFKKVNDDYGHHAGDEVLRETSRRCRSVLREVDHFGRLGGEEFVIILPQSNLHQGIRVAERLRNKVCESGISIGGSKLPVSISIGAAEMRSHDDFSKLLQDADVQLYRAKKCGRNQVSPPALRLIGSRRLKISFIPEQRNEQKEL